MNVVEAQFWLAELEARRDIVNDVIMMRITGRGITAREFYPNATKFNNEVLSKKLKEIGETINKLLKAIDKAEVIFKRNNKIGLI